MTPEEKVSAVRKKWDRNFWGAAVLILLLSFTPFFHPKMVAVGPLVILLGCLWGLFGDLRELGAEE